MSGQDSEEPLRTSRHARSGAHLRIGCISICLLIIIAVLIDWSVWSYRDDRLVRAASRAGASDVGGLLGWPIGSEYRIGFEAVPTDAQLAQLEALNHLPRNGHVSVMIRTCVADEVDMRRISAALHSCFVFQMCDGEVVFPNEGE